MNVNKYYSQLVGAKIVGFNFIKDEYGFDDWPTFTLQLGNQKVNFVLCQDEECNGAGFGSIEEIKQ